MVKRSEVCQHLRRELAETFGEAIDLRTALVARSSTASIGGKAAPGRAALFAEGAAPDSSTGLAKRGVIPVSPLAGYRKPRRTRAQMVEQPGRALDDAEIAKLWRATDTWFGTLVRLCLLTGARRGEAAAMELDDLDLEAGEWLIRAEVAKTGRARVVYLAPLAVELLRGVARTKELTLVFPIGRRHSDHRLDKARRGASQGVAKVEFAMHDLRGSSAPA